MTQEHTDIFHCLKCGRVAYQPHGTPAPTCCGQKMVCAVPDVVRDASVPDARVGDARADDLRENPCPCAAEAPLAADAEEHALLQEFAELARWCRTVEETNGLRYDQLAQRLRALHGVLLDHFDDEERSGDLAKVLAAGPRFSPKVGSLRHDHQELLWALDHFIHDLHEGESCFRGWAEVCARFDSIAADYQRHERAETELVRSALNEDVGADD